SELLAEHVVGRAAQGRVRQRPEQPEGQRAEHCVQGRPAEGHGEDEEDEEEARHGVEGTSSASFVRGASPESLGAESSGSSPPGPSPPRSAARPEIRARIASRSPITENIKGTMSCAMPPPPATRTPAAPKAARRAHRASGRLVAPSSAGGTSHTWPAPPR